MSPIAGLTRRVDYDQRRAMPRLAKLKKGAPKSEKRPGQDLDHFRVEFEPQYKYLEPIFNEMYGETPTEFSVQLYGKTVEDVFSTGYESWNATTLLHLCDGETQAQHWDESINRYNREPIACEKISEDKMACGCSRVGRLNFIIPEFTDASGIMGKFTIETHSIFDIIKLFNQLMFLEDMFNSLMWMPAIVGRADEQKSYTAQNGKRGKKSYSLLYIKYYVPLLKDYLEPQLPGVNNEMLALPQGDDNFDVVETYQDRDALPASKQVAKQVTQETSQETSQKQGIDPEKIADWLQSRLNISITSQDVVESFAVYDFNYQSVGQEAKLYAIALALEYWFQDGETGELNLDLIETAIPKLIDDKDAQNTIIKYIIGESYSVEE